MAGGAPTLRNDTFPSTFAARVNARRFSLPLIVQNDAGTRVVSVPPDVAE